MRIKNRLLIYAAAAALAAAVLTSACDEDETPSPSPGNGTITIDRISFTWEVEGKYLNATVKAPTTGWVGVGFDPAIVMKDANVILGYVKDDEVFTRDDFGDTLFGHRSDVERGGTDDVSNPRGKEVNGSTEISFTIPLNSGDEHDRVLIPGKTYKVLFAYGPNGADDFWTKHEVRTWTYLKI